jgi:CRISPR/Cas system-associated protein Csx1
MELQVIENTQLQVIENLIYEIRGQKIMIETDLARMYDIETKRLKEAVRRNINRFPKDFMFELNNQEVTSLRSQIATLKILLLNIFL